LLVGCRRQFAVWRAVQIDIRSVEIRIGHPRFVSVNRPRGSSVERTTPKRVPVSGRARSAARRLRPHALGRQRY
jgi:hypothetical protein